MWKALTVVALPVLNEEGFPTGETTRKEPGDKITKDEMSKAGQTDADIENMEDAGSISGDMDAEFHPDHRPVAVGEMSLGQMVEQAKLQMERLGKDAPDEIKALAKLDVTDVTPNGEKAKAGDKRG